MERLLDHGMVPAAVVPEGTYEALTYLTHALGHTCYERWTIARLKRHYPSLGDARKHMPKVFQLLLEHQEVVQWWAQGRLHTAATPEAPSAEVVLARLLHTHRRRFKRPAIATMPAEAIDETHRWLSIVNGRQTDLLATWLGRCGRFINKDSASNTLATANDAQALALFLRDRANRSRHTLRAYAGDLNKLIQWARDRNEGPLSDLTRNDLLAYRDALAAPRAATDRSGRLQIKRVSDNTQARALAVAASLYQYWFDTGYLVANPASGLITGAAGRNTFSPTRFLPQAVLAACDQWVDTSAPSLDVSVLRRNAIWILFRYSGVRLAELAWDAERNLPRIDIADGKNWTLYVHGKGDKTRAVPLPTSAVGPLRAYRVARGLPSDPEPHEVLPLIHGLKGGSLRSGGLYNEIKALFHTVAHTLDATEAPCGTALLQAASPHWLRHAYAKALVIDNRVPLPVAQSLLGHASIQTTAAYARTDLSQLREFVEISFAK